MRLKRRRLSNSDYNTAGVLCEMVFLAFALGGRLGENNLGVYGGLFAIAGLVLIARGYTGRWPGEC